MPSGTSSASTSNSDTVASDSITQWGWNYGLTNPTIASPFPDQANYFSADGADDAATPHWTVVIESENGPGISAPGPADQSFPINAVTQSAGQKSSVATLQVLHTLTTGIGNGLSVDLQTDLYDNAQPNGVGYFTWYAFGENVDLDGGPLPPPAIASFDVNLLYNAWLPDAGARATITYQAFWNGQSFEFDLDVNRQSTDWGTNSGTLVQSVQLRPGLTDVQLNGTALGLSLIPGVETHVHVDWASIIETLVRQGTIAGPVGGWANSASQAFYVGTELNNQAASQSGTTALSINSFDVSGNPAGGASTTTPVAGDTMFSIVTGGSGTVETDSQSGAIVQALPLVSAGAMQFISVDDINYGTNMASAQSLGLDPSQLHDYGGNPLGVTGQWVFLGSASVQPGAAPSYILVDPTTGRWAEVAVQANGSINFQNYGQNGSTRVVGTYLDPLIALGQVVAGGPEDSQKAFNSDVENNNLDVLGSVYDQQNGGMDLMFGLKDAPGFYLRAILHTDGNIQYANYVSAAQLTQWATGAEIALAVYSTWLKT